MPYLNKLWLKKKNYFIKKLSDFNFMPGQVIKIFYITRHKKKKRYYFFIGLCLYKNIWKFRVTNLIRRERIFFTFPLIGPSILKVFIIYMYKIFSTRVKKIHYKRSLSLIDDVSVFTNIILSSDQSIKYHLTSLFYSERWTNAKSKRYIRKHRYNLTWQECYVDYLD